MAEMPQAITTLYPQAYALPLPGSPGTWYVADRPNGSIIGMGEGKSGAIVNAVAAACRLGVLAMRSS